MSDIPAVANPPVPITHDAPPAWALWSVRLLSLVAVGISGYLANLAYTGNTAAGCGRSSGLGCEHVLSSRWSFWISILSDNRPPIDVPVSAAAFALWLTALLVSLFAGMRFLPGFARPCWLLVAVLTTSAAGAALWFIGLQAFRLHHWCLYCLAAHACALVACAIVLGSRGLTLGNKRTAVAMGTALALLVPIGQFALPFKADNLYEVADVVDTAAITVAGPHSDSSSPKLPVLGGATKIDVFSLPRLGSDDSPYVAVLLYDYACSHCRELHREALAAQQQYQGQLTLVMLPTPLSHHCNRHITAEQSTSPDACGLAKLALMVWYAAPEKFAAFDAWLFENRQFRKLADARAHAVSLIGEEAVSAGEADTQLDSLLQQNIELYDRSPADLLPQILGKNVVLEAGVDSTAELLEVLHEDFGFAR
jgi:uncharacterized membrane protein/protein-disulfide isomerase